MEVKPRYRQTELGVIPTDWDVVRLGELAEVVTSGSRGWARFYSETGALFIRSQNVRDVHLCFEDVQHVSPPVGAEGNRTKVRLNDLLITVTGNSVGNVAMVEQAFDEAYISQHVGLVRLKDPDKACFVCRYLSPSSPGNPQIAGSQSGQSKPGLNLRNLKDFLIALPHSKDERQSVATALGDMDNLVDSLERLIAKKRGLKQAAMQQLLTGQTRLPGFSEKWTECDLGDIGVFAKGQGIRKDQVRESGLPCIRYGEIYTRHNDFIRRFYSFIDPKTAAEAYRLRSGDLLFAGSGETAEEIGKCVAFVGTEEAYAGGDIVILSPQGHDSRFLGYLMNHPCVAKQKARMGQGDAVCHIGARSLSAVTLRLPGLSEQHAIAEVLSDMDAEITALEARLTKTRDLKQGMMQELLTGRTRLV